jgi:diacylglycerol kinase family enzyme
MRYKHLKECKLKYEMKYFLIMNPSSHGGKSKKRFRRIWKLLDNRGINYVYKSTQSLDHARCLSQFANEQNYDAIVAVGGDGTINSVLNGFFDDNGNRISDSKMGVIYTGTSPDFCKSYNIPLNLDESVDTLIAQRSRKIKVGKVTFLKENIKMLNNCGLENTGRNAVGYFACCANIGLGATLARNANSGIRKYTGDFLGTFLSLIKTVASYRAIDFTIVKDEKKTTVENLFNISVGRTKYIASGIKLNTGLDDDDDRFYCMTVTNLNWFNFPKLVKKIYGNFLNPEIEYDGDPVGYLPCRIELANDTLELFVKNR